ncbi:MAG TPA: RNA-directed DNA polymerase [Candidatus Nanoarchaeia archaeon]|nr:RNA-directed DNA polymerase [Candidatus Nanoarchaeia archaeon]
MPLGNLTSQFFANVYLDQLDQFVKHELRIKYYIRYVDDFVILDNNFQNLEKYKEKINEFLIKILKIDLHPGKSKIIKIDSGVNLLGYRVFSYHRLLRKNNKRKFERNFKERVELYKNGILKRSDFEASLQGWFGYAMWANTYKLRQNIAELVKKH